MSATGFKMLGLLNPVEGDQVVKMALPIVDPMSVNDPPGAQTPVSGPASTISEQADLKSCGSGECGSWKRCFPGLYQKNKKQSPERSQFNMPEKCVLLDKVLLD